LPARIPCGEEVESTLLQGLHHAHHLQALGLETRTSAVRLVGAHDHVPQQVSLPSLTLQRLGRVGIPVSSCPEQLREPPM
jgi:hypothetical protein